MAKLNNNKKFPLATKQPRHLDNLRKTLAKERDEANAKLTLEQKIAKLPPEPFSKRERARLLAALEKQNQAKQVVAPTAVTVTEDAVVVEPVKDKTTRKTKKNKSE